MGSEVPHEILRVLQSFALLEVTFCNRRKSSLPACVKNEACDPKHTLVILDRVGGDAEPGAGVRDYCGASAS